MQRRQSKTIKIPFCGLYDSDASHALAQQIPDDSYDTLDHPALSVAFAELYTKMFAEYLKDTCGITISLFFEELDSPQFYDADTDKIYCKISPADIEKLWDILDTDELNRVVKDMLSQDNPLVTFGDNELSKGDWSAPVTEWDLEQLELMLWAILRQHNVEQIDYAVMFEQYQKDICKIVRDYTATQEEMVG